MKPKPKLTPHQLIVRAAKAGKGLRLTADQVWELFKDDAITHRAALDDMNREGTSDGDIY